MSDFAAVDIRWTDDSGEEEGYYYNFSATPLPVPDVGEEVHITEWTEEVRQPWHQGESTTIRLRVLRREFSYDGPPNRAAIITLYCERVG